MLLKTIFLHLGHFNVNSIALTKIIYLLIFLTGNIEVIFKFLVYSMLQMVITIIKLREKTLHFNAFAVWKMNFMKQSREAPMTKVPITLG